MVTPHYCVVWLCLLSIDYKVLWIVSEKVWRVYVPWLDIPSDDIINHMKLDRKKSHRLDEYCWHDWSSIINKIFKNVTQSRKVIHSYFVVINNVSVQWVNLPVVFAYHFTHNKNNKLNLYAEKSVFLVKNKWRKTRNIIERTRKNTKIFDKTRSFMFTV